MIPFFSRMFPGTNLQDLNLDWICRRIMELSKGIIAPWINPDNKDWMVYDTETEQFVDSGVSAQGETLSEVAHKLATWDVETCGKILFLGNSYGKNTGYPDIIKWPERAAEYLGLTSADFFNNCVPSHSLYGTDGTNAAFITDLRAWVRDHSADIDSIGAVVLVAGINDARSGRSTHVAEKLAELSAYIAETIPNAVCYCGYTGWINESAKASSDTHGNFTYRLSVAQQYMQAKQNGWNYLSGIENVFHDKRQMVDYVHPNQAGEDVIGAAVANALITGSASVCNTATALAVDTTITIEGTDYASTVRNGNVVQQYENGNIYTRLDSLEFEFSPAVPMKANTIYYLGTIDLPLSNLVDFGNQILLVRTDTDTSGRTAVIARMYINPRTDASGVADICMQLKAFADGSATKNVTRLVRFVADTVKLAVAD